MSFSLIAMLLFLMLPQAQPARDPNAADPNAPAAKQDIEGVTPRRPFGLKVFTNMDRPLSGQWELEIPEAITRKIEIREPEAGKPGSLVGIDLSTSEEILRLSKKKEGIGYEGQILKVFTACGLDSLPINEFLPLGESAVLKFETQPPSAPCPPIESGRAGHFYTVSRRGGPVRLRDLSDISSPTVRETYSIGGDRPNVESSYDIPIGAVSIDDGSEVKFLQRLKAPLDSTYWFEVEAMISHEAGVEPPRGFLKSDSLRFVGSLTLKRVKPSPPAPR